MRAFTCQCGNQLMYEHTECSLCGRAVGFIPETLTLGAFESEGPSLVPIANTGAKDYQRCANATEHGCNWMVQRKDGGDTQFCLSCGLNKAQHDYQQSPIGANEWLNVEQAKRRLLYSLLALGLPVDGRETHPAFGLGFEFQDPANPTATAICGGHRGITDTIVLFESNDSLADFTPLDLLRHESGHYYWNVLVNNTPWLDGFRSTFGDERMDYDSAMTQYLRYGPPANWQREHLSPYGSVHPSEDWAETWAHYLQLVDALETAHHLELSIAGSELVSPVTAVRAKQKQLPFPKKGGRFEDLMSDWQALREAMNSLNRSMGLAEPWPLSIPVAVNEKLEYVHRSIVRAFSLSG